MRASPAWRPAKDYNPVRVPDLSKNPTQSDARDEENLLIEAIGLLVQRQRETESLVADQVWQAENRAAATERHYTDLEARLTGIEDQLTRLIRELDPAQSDAAVDERMARLREQIEGLKTGPDGGPPRPSVRLGLPAFGATPESASPHEPATGRGWPAPANPQDPATGRAAREPATAPEPAAARSWRAPARPPGAAADARPRMSAYATTAEPREASLWDLLGATAQERFGVVLIVVGALAVIYAILSQLPLR